MTADYLAGEQPAVVSAAAAVDAAGKLLKELTAGL